MPSASTLPRPFNLPGYGVADTEILAFGQRRIRIEAAAVLPGVQRDQQPRAFTPAQRPRVIPIAGRVEVIWPTTESVGM